MVDRVGEEIRLRQQKRAEEYAAKPKEVNQTEVDASVANIARAEARKEAEMEKALIVIEGEKVRTHPKEGVVVESGDQYEDQEQNPPNPQPEGKIKKAQRFMRENPLGNYAVYGIEMIPFLGDGLNVLEGAFGHDPLTDLPIVGWDRVWYIAGGLIPGVPGRFIRDVKNVLVEGTKQLIYGDDYQKIEGGKKAVDVIKAGLEHGPKIVKGVQKIGKAAKTIRRP